MLKCDNDFTYLSVSSFHHLNIDSTKGNETTSQYHLLGMEK